MFRIFFEVLQIVFSDRLFAYFCSGQWQIVALDNFWQIVIPNKFFANCYSRQPSLTNCHYGQYFGRLLFPTVFLGQGDPGGPHGRGDSESSGSPGGRGSQGGQGGIVRQAV